MFLYAAPKSFKTGKQLLSRRAERRADGQTQSRPTHCWCGNERDEQIGAQGTADGETGQSLRTGCSSRGAESRRLQFTLPVVRALDGRTDGRTGLLKGQTFGLTSQNCTASS